MKHQTSNSPRLRELQGLGKVSEQHLIMVGIDCESKLRDVGGVEAFRRLRKHPDLNPSLNFLYALVGAIEDRSWLEVAREERESLLMALEGFDELARELAKEGIDVRYDD